MTTYIHTHEEVRSSCHSRKTGETKMEIESITKEDCEAYEAVRVSGVTNMFMVATVCEISGLSREKVMTIMENYGKLNEKFNFRRSLSRRYKDLYR